MERIKQIEQFVLDLIKRQELIYLGTVDENGYPAVRAMLRPRKFDDIRNMWFTTHTPSNKTIHLEREPKCSVYICDSVRLQGVLLRGEAKLYDASNAESRLAFLGDALFVPRAETNPDYMAIEFKAKSGRLYYQRGSEDFVLTTP